MRAFLALRRLNTDTIMAQDGKGVKVRELWLGNQVQ